MSTDLLEPRNLGGVENPVRRGQPSGPLAILRGAPRARLFVFDEPTPCQSEDADDRELWFADPTRPGGVQERELAVMACQACPFRGRCAYNAVAVRATHGVWAGVELPGDKARLLTVAYARLLRQFEERRQVEIGSAPVDPLTAEDHFLRRPAPPTPASPRARKPAARAGSAA
jgi:WhiB family redox-sensing transcriptional regulator